MKKLIFLLFLVMLVINASAGNIVTDLLGIPSGTADTKPIGKMTPELSAVAVNNQGNVPDRETNNLQQTPDKKVSVFQSWSTNLIPASGVTVRAFVKMTDGTLMFIRDNSRMPAVSPDGRYVAYEYSADYNTALPEIRIYDLKTNSDSFLGYTSGGNAYGWTTQNFTWVNSTIVSYLTSDPTITGGTGFTTVNASIADAKQMITVKPVNDKTKARVF